MKRAVLAISWITISVLIFLIINANAPGKNELAPVDVELEFPTSTPIISTTSSMMGVIKEPIPAPMDTSTIELSIDGVIKKPEEKMIYIRNSKFIPMDLDIKPGTKVTWINSDDIDHRVTVKDKFDTGNFGKARKFSYYFNATGTYIFSCVIHPFSRGKIVVE